MERVSHVPLIQSVNQLLQLATSPEPSTLQRSFSSTINLILLTEKV